jgi:O-antigen ligase
VSLGGRLLDLDRLSPNYLAMYLVPIVVLALVCLIWRIRERKNHWFLLGALLVMVLTLVLTQSRGALVALGATLIVWLYSILRRKLHSRALTKTVFALVLIGYLGAALYFYRPLSDDLGRTGQSSNIRYYIWSTSFEIARKTPIFGVGLSNFQDYFSDLTKDRVNFAAYISPQALTAHNLYLHIYLTMGILGIVVFVALIAQSGFWHFSDRAASLALVAVIFYGLVDTPIFRNDLSGLFWIILALSFTSNAEKKN